MKNIIKNKTYIILLIIFILFLINSNLSFSKEEIFGNIDASKLRAPTSLSGDFDIKKYIRDFYQIAINVSIILAVLMIVIGGIYYSISGAIDKKKEAKEMIFSAVFGLVLILGIYLILNLLNPRLAKLELFENITPVSQQTQNSTTSLADMSLIVAYNSAEFAKRLEDLAKNILNNSDPKNKKFVIQNSGECYTDEKYRTFYGNDELVTPLTTLRAIADGYLPPVCQDGCKKNKKKPCFPKKFEETEFLRLLETLNSMSEYTQSSTSIFSNGITITSLTGGDHSEDSPHYQGRGIDLVVHSQSSTIWEKVRYKLSTFGQVSQAICEIYLTIYINEIKLQGSYTDNNGNTVYKTKTLSSAPNHLIEKEDAHLYLSDCNNIFEPLNLIKINNDRIEIKAIGGRTKTDIENYINGQIKTFELNFKKNELAGTGEIKKTEIISYGIEKPSGRHIHVTTRMYIPPSPPNIKH